MKIPDIPQDEPYRLQALRALNILDTEREERFDRLTRLTRRLFDVPVAMLSFADEGRMWFKSTAGMDFTEIPRETSFCGHVVLNDEIFIVPDAVLDERFHDNPGVTNEPGIRFYAGCPLHHPDGTKIGSLSMMDYKPRHMSENDIENLRDLTSIVESELRAAYLATRDVLVDINNRRGFMNLAEQSLVLCRRQSLPVSLVFFDLDEFKQINDRFGHRVGDQALRHFADLLKLNFRTSDICARISGDEFVVLLPNTRRTLAEEVNQRFLEALARSNASRHQQYDLVCSWGIVEFDPLEHESIEDLMNAGDNLMYKAKASNAEKGSYAGH